MQTLWDFKEFIQAGFPPKHFARYFKEVARWQPLGELEVCDPTKPCTRRHDYDIAVSYKDYFQPLRNTSSRNGSSGYITSFLAEAAGFRLKWTLQPRCLRIQPGQWNEPAILPDTNPKDFLFWFCTSDWQKAWGGNLLVTPPEGEAQELVYHGGKRAVMTYGLPHVLLPISPKAETPYYCLYGQLQEEKEDL